MRRREFIVLVGGAAIGRSLSASAQQQPASPVVAFLRDGSAEGNARNLAGFRKGLNAAGYTEGQNVTVEYYWLEGQYDRLPAILADLVRRQVTAIVTPGNVPTRAAKAATDAIPIIFGVGEDPVRLGLVASFARPGGNATGTNFQTSEVLAKRLRLLHDLVPKAARIAVLVHPGNPAVSSVTVQEIQKAAPAIGLQIQVLNAATVSEIDAAFATLERERADALFVAPDGFFISRRAQLVTLTARNKIPAIYSTREFVDAGGLMSYGADLTEMFRQMGTYTGSILKGSKPADLPVLQSTRFEFVINLTTAKALGLSIPEGVLTIADDVIE
jgi:putative tryptophan/tyrosine transport system substrate-binding protein